LADAYRNSLRAAVANKFRTVAFPSISTGAYGYPIHAASRVALGTVKDFLEEEDGLDEVVFVLFSEGDLKIYAAALKEI
jgi:O-acetyl-ADP-ribose deacetylase (regulator of RNase III)